MFWSLNSCPTCRDCGCQKNVRSFMSRQQELDSCVPWILTNSPWIHKLASFRSVMCKQNPLKYFDSNRSLSVWTNTGQNYTLFCRLAVSIMITLRWSTGPTTFPSCLTPPRAYWTMRCRYFSTFFLISLVISGWDCQSQDRGHLLPARWDRKLQRGWLWDGSK